MRQIWLAALVLYAVAMSGCVERSLRVESEPAGAEVYIDGVYQGDTPLEIPFDFYGTREIRLEKQNFESVIILQDVSPPPYEWFPFDFVSENVLPWTMKDEHALEVELTPRRLISLDEKDKLLEAIQDRARETRTQMEQDD